MCETPSFLPPSNWLVQGLATEKNGLLGPGSGVLAAALAVLQVRAGSEQSCLLAPDDPRVPEARGSALVRVLGRS